MDEPRTASSLNAASRKALDELVLTPGRRPFVARHIAFKRFYLVGGVGEEQHAR